MSIQYDVIRVMQMCHDYLCGVVLISCLYGYKWLTVSHGSG